MGPRARRACRLAADPRQRAGRYVRVYGNGQRIGTCQVGGASCATRTQCVAEVDVTSVISSNFLQVGASWFLQRALLTTRVTPGSHYRCAQST